MGSIGFVNLLEPFKCLYNKRTLKKNNEKVEAEKQLFTKENERNPQALYKIKK